MNLKAALAKVFGLAAILAALAFAPSAAQAHGQHGHTAPAVVAVQLPALAVSVDKLPTLTLNDQTVHDHNATELRSAPLAVPAADNVICVQSCCAGAPCHSSTACTLGHDLSVLLPQDAGLNLLAWSVPGIAGHDPEGIRKPPKTFA